MKISQLFGKIFLALASGALVALLVFQKDVFQIYEKTQMRLKKEEQRLHFEDSDRLLSEIYASLGRNQYAKARELNEKLQKIPNGKSFKMIAEISLAEYSSKKKDLIEVERGIQNILNLGRTYGYEVTDKILISKIYLSIGQYANGIKILEFDDAKLDPEFRSMIHEARGDLFTKNKNIAIAQREYEFANELLQDENPKKDEILRKIRAINIASEFEVTD